MARSNFLTGLTSTKNSLTTQVKLVDNVFILDGLVDTLWVQLQLATQPLDALGASGYVQYRVKRRNLVIDNSAFTTCIDKKTGAWQTVALTSTRSL